MKTIKYITFTSLAFAFFLAMLSQVVKAQSMFVGYDDFCGLPVIVESTTQDAVATIRNGQRVIIVDPYVISNWKLSRIFALAHECGHHVLGHLSIQEQFSRRHMNATRRQELQADCWAAEALASNGYYDDIRRTIIQNASQGPIMQGPYPSGMERASFISQCAGIQLPPPGLPSGHVMQQCGCWGGFPSAVVAEPKCQSGSVQIVQCSGYCQGGGSPYGYVCR